MENNHKLLVNAVVKFVSSLIIVAILLFGSARTIEYWNGWLYLIIIGTVMFIIGTYLYTKDPELLTKRLNTKEKEEKQQLVVLLGTMILSFTFILSGVDFRFRWSHVSLILVIIASFFLIFGFFLFFLVLVQNSYASRVVEIQNNQKLIDTGLYALIRHPMYLSSLIIYFSSAIVLGSFLSIIPVIIYTFILIYRIKNEEIILIKGLNGYEEYMKRVKYRLIPFIW